MVPGGTRGLVPGGRGRAIPPPGPAVPADGRGRGGPRFDDGGVAAARVAGAVGGDGADPPTFREPAEPVRRHGAVAGAVAAGRALRRPDVRHGRIVAGGTRHRRAGRRPGRPSRRRLEQDLDRRTRPDRRAGDHRGPAGATVTRRGPGRLRVQPDRRRPAPAKRRLEAGRAAGPGRRAMAGRRRPAHPPRPTAWTPDVTPSQTEPRDNAPCRPKPRSPSARTPHSQPVPPPVRRRATRPSSSRRHGRPGARRSRPQPGPIPADRAASWPRSPPMAERSRNWCARERYACRWARGRQILERPIGVSWRARERPSADHALQLQSQDMSRMRQACVHRGRTWNPIPDPSRRMASLMDGILGPHERGLCVSGSTPTAPVADKTIEEPMRAPP